MTKSYRPAKISVAVIVASSETSVRRLLGYRTVSCDLCKVPSVSAYPGERMFNFLKPLAVHHLRGNNEIETSSDSTIFPHSLASF
jgi:hypothetical protein